MTKSKNKGHRSRVPQKNRSSNPVVPMEDIEDKEPEVRAKHPKVTDRQHELVATLLHDGRTVASACEQIDADRTWASKTLNKQHVIDYANDLAKCVLGVHSIRALAKMGNLLNSKSDHVALEAARDLMDRAGLGNDGSAGAPPLTINISL